MRTLLHRSRAALAVLLAVALLGSACATADTRQPDEVMRDVIRNTETQPRRFVYQYTTPEADYRVEGLFEDDFRYEASFWIGDTLAYEEIVSDDRLAVRMHDPRALDILRRPEPTQEELAELAELAGVDPTATPTPSESTSGEPTEGTTGTEQPTEEPSDEATPESSAEPSEGPSEDEVDVEALLLSGVWVEDSVGAPSLLPSVDDRDLGQDPVLDGLKILRYVLTAMQEGFDIRIFDDESVFYRPSEDPFPHPDPDAGEVDRIDFERLWLPRKSDVNESGQQPAPSMGNLRKMVMYVDEDEHVMRVLEIVDLQRRFKDLRERYDMDLPEDLPDDVLEQMALEQINALRVAQGDDPIELRTLTLEFTDVGDEQIKVRFPTGTTIASLRILAQRGSETGSPPEIVEATETATDADADVPDPEVAPAADDTESTAPSESATPSESASPSESAG